MKAACAPGRVITLCLALVVVPVLIGPAAGLAQDANTPVMERLRELLAVLNSGERSRIQQFVEESLNAQMRDSFPIEQHLAILGGVRERAGDLALASVQSGDEHSAVVVLRGEETDTWLEMEVAVEADPPHRVAGIGIRPGVPPAASGPIAADTDLTADLDAYVGELARQDRFSGTVLVAKDGEVLYTSVQGLANRDFEVPNNLATRFNLGSMNKMFTAVATAQLVERGQLAYADPLAKYLPEFPDPASAAKIRIEHLLTHTSGLGSYFNEEFMRSSRARFRTVEDLMQLAEGETLAFEPGTRWSYSNTGFLVLGRVIEVVTGLDYHEYIRTNVTGPAGMIGTDAYELDRVTPNLAIGYERDERGWRNNLFEHVIRGGPAGGGYSTVEDLLAFAEALRAGTLVSRATLALMTSPKPELQSPNYGYGFGIAGDGSVGHSGGFSGINSNLSIWIDEGWVSAVMSNVGQGAQPVARRIAQLIAARQGGS